MKNSMTSTMRVLGCCCAMFYTLTAMGQSAEPTHQLARAADLKWTPSFMGCEHADVSGDPSAGGKPFVLRIRCPDGAKVPPHWHPTDENMTVLKGTFMIGLENPLTSPSLRRWTREASSLCQEPCATSHCAEVRPSSKFMGSGHSKSIG